MVDNNLEHIDCWSAEDSVAREGNVNDIEFDVLHSSVVMIFESDWSGDLFDRVNLLTAKPY